MNLWFAWCHFTSVCLIFVSLVEQLNLGADCPKKFTEQFFLCRYFMVYLVFLVNDWMLLSSTFLWPLFTMLYEVVRSTFKSINEIPKFDHSNESLWSVLPGCRSILFTMSCRWLLSFFFSLCMGEILVKCDYSNESFRAVLSRVWCSDHYVAQGDQV